MSDADSEPWAWLFSGRYIGLAVTFTRGLTPDELLERYGADPSTARPLPYREIALQSDIDHAMLRVGTLGEWAFGIEESGIQGIAPATLARLSHGTETISVFSGANAFQMFMYWVDGQPREQFEPGTPSTLHAAGPHPFWDAAERHRTARPGSRDILTVMLGVEDHIGARLTEETDDGPLPSLPLRQIRPTLISPGPTLPQVNLPAVPSVGRQGLGPSLGALRLPSEKPHDRPTLHAKPNFT